MIEVSEDGRHVRFIGEAPSKASAPAGILALPGEAIACKVIDYLIVLSEGQTPEQRKIMWDWFIEDWGKVRKFLGGDG